MRAQLIVTVLAVSLAAPAWAGDRAVPRGGGSHSSSAGSRHPSPSGGGHSGSGSSSAVPHSGAQARHPRPGTGHAYRGGHYGGYYGHRYPYYGGYYGYPYYYGYYGYPYAWGFGLGWYDGYYTPPYYPYRDYDDAYGQLRILVEPSKARVYVDGYYAGEVDEFDGMFQRLDVAPGRHEITFKLEGYVSHRVKLYAPPDTTVKIRHDMVKGSGPETVEDRISEEDQRAMREEEPRYDPERDRRERARRPAPTREPREPEAEAEDVPPPATLRLRVAPEDASIYIDGRFRGTGRQLDELLLPPGRHKLEVVRPGYRTHESEFEVNDEQPTDLELSLDKLG